MASGADLTEDDIAEIFSKRHTASADSDSDNSGKDNSDSDNK